MQNDYQITINESLENLMELFLNQDNFKHWQRGLIGFENLTQEIGMPGSKRKLKIKTLVGTVTMVEEITKRDLPHHWEATYRTKGVVNYQSNRFRESEKIIDNKTIKQTIWDSTSTFKFTGMMRLVAAAKPDLFEKQGYQFMQDFKRFAEEGISATQA